MADNHTDQHVSFKFVRLDNKLYRHLYWIVAMRSFCNQSESYWSILRSDRFLLTVLWTGTKAAERDDPICEQRPVALFALTPFSYISNVTFFCLVG